MGGVEKAFQEIVNGLLKTNRYDISVWCKTKITDQYFLDFFEEKNVKIYDHLYDEPKSESCIKNIQRFLCCFRNRYVNNKLFLKHAKNSDIIIDFKNGCMQNRIKEIKNKPKIVWLHCSFKVITQDIKTNCSIYNKVICISNQLRLNMEQHIPHLKEKFETIYIPHDIEKIKNLTSKKDDISKSESQLINSNYFLVVSRLSKDKDLDTVILAYKLFINETSSETKLYFIGDGNDRPRLEKLVQNFGLSKIIFFLGQKNNPHAFVKNSKASILSSKEEGAPLVIVEGMILKTIVVSSDCPTAPRELLNNGKCGVLFKPGNAEELKNIMIKIDNNKITKEHFSKNIDKWICKFDTSIIIKQIEDIFSNLQSVKR